MMLAAMCVGCGETSDPTRLLVVVTTDFEVPGELAAVHAQVGPEAGCDACSAEFALSGTERHEMPLSFVIAPRDGDASRPIALQLEGRDERGAAIVVRTVRTSFVAGSTARVVVHLERACEARTCTTAGLTCVAGDCRGDEVAPEIFDGYGPGDELRDAGVRDAGVRDAGEHDAGGGEDAQVEVVDAGDAGTVEPSDGGTSPRSCEGLDGRQQIDPDGAGASPPFWTWCLDGWTLLLKVDGGSPRMAFTNDEWVTSTAAPFGTEMPGAVEDAMLPSYWSLPVRELRVVMREGATSRDQVFPLLGEGLPVTLVSAVRDDVPVEVGGTLAEWTSLVGTTAVQGEACTRVGIPAQAPDGDPRVRVRIGIVASSQSDCSQASGWAGIGASVAGQAGCSTFGNTAGGARLCGNPPNRREAFPRFALVYGR
ncbi:hypothetical protein DB32_006860 [Sandaracinus amylolyticus]|uniref:Uncharacterized protein n=1 Tax=Sandaracinus amylolyticus TaxID=927083 RepID=A0A0F6W7Y4_9BACT|nr:hypothetical protein DB32_006860 [Sandaracinus amylolyticus]